MIRKSLLSLAALCCLMIWSGHASAQENPNTETAIRVSSDNFTLSGKIDGAQAVDIISELERFRSALLEIHDLPANSPDRILDIYVVTDPEVFDILGVGADFIALYSPTPAGPRALINGSREGMTTEPGSTLRWSLRHEYAHHFIYTHLPLAQPRWLAEGLAEYYAGYEELEDGSFQIGAQNEDSQIILSYPVDGWADMRGLLRSHQDIQRRIPSHVRLPPKGWDRIPDNVNFFYAQSWALVHWAMNRNGATDIQAGHELLGDLAEKLIDMESYLKRSDEATAPPNIKAWQESNLSLDDIAAEIAEESLGLPLQKYEKDEDISGTFETALSDYVAGSPPVLTRNPRPGRLTAKVTVVEPLPV